MIAFIEREQYQGRKPAEVGQEFQKIVDEYKSTIENISVEEAKEQEKELMGLMDKWDEVQKGIQYKLPKEIASPAGNMVTRSSVGKYICEMLNKVECEFSYTLGYYQLFMWWKKPQSIIDYKTLDATLHVLGSGLKFRGPAQWEMILTINEYFKPMHDMYSIDNMITYVYSMCHQAILDKLKIEAPVTEQPKEVEAEQGPIQIDEGVPVGEEVK